MTGTHRYTVYGIDLVSDLAFSWLERCRIPDAARGAGADHRSRAQVAFRTVHGPLPAHLADGLDTGVPIEGDDALVSPITFHPAGSTTVVRFDGAADHVVEDGSITCYLTDERRLPLVQVQLLGTVLAVWLETQGVTTLHASVVQFDGGAVALLGAPGGGKTTLAAAAVVAGARFVVDDLAALDRRGESVVVRPGYPMLRLWPEQATAFAGGVAGLDTVHPWYDKLVAPLGDRVPGTAATMAAPLACVVVPSRNTDRGDVHIKRLDTAQSLQALIGGAFLPGPVHGLGLAAGRLPMLAWTVARVPVVRLEYPSGFERLPQVIAALRTASERR